MSRRLAIVRASGWAFAYQVVLVMPLAILFVGRATASLRPGAWALREAQMAEGGATLLEIIVRLGRDGGPVAAGAVVLAGLLWPLGVWIRLAWLRAMAEDRPLPSTLRGALPLLPRALGVELALSAVVALAAVVALSLLGAFSFGSFRGVHRLLASSDRGADLVGLCVAASIFALVLVTRALRDASQAALVACASLGLEGRVGAALGNWRLVIRGRALTYYLGSWFGGVVISLVALDLTNGVQTMPALVVHLGALLACILRGAWLAWIQGRVLAAQR